MAFIFVHHLLKEFQLGNLTKGVDVRHFSTSCQKNFKTKNFFFSLKLAEVYRGVYFM